MTEQLELPLEETKKPISLADFEKEMERIKKLPADEWLKAHGWKEVKLDD